MRTHCRPLLAALVLAAYSATQPPTVDSVYLDFWIGDWDLAWKESDGTEGKGRNRIEKIMDGKVVHERFEALAGMNKGFKGESWSGVDPASRSWRQTWVDNAGNFMVFDSLASGGDKGFHRRTRDPKGQEVMQRMRFTQIQANGLVWLWEASPDEGKTWELRWRIDYSRRKS